LYNHVTDPYEWDNLAYDKKHTSIKNKLAKEMNAILAN
jgi:hypothetical protein